MDRRSFLAGAGATVAAMAMGRTARPADDPGPATRPAVGAGRRPRILLRSSWQTVNIGDVAHTPGVLALLERHVPEADVSLWPSSVADGVEAMLRRRFPKLEIVRGPEAQRRALATCDALLHGSGPSLVAAADVARWRREAAGRPYGVYGITLPSVDAALAELLSGAAFVFCRDSVSLKLARDKGVKAPVLDFAPDGAFAADVRDDAAAEAFLKATGLEAGKFLCCIPRLRYTPYWRIKKGVAFNQARHDRNEAMKEHDHAPLREAIVEVVRRTPMKVLVCPEDASQMAVGKEMLVDPLPEDVRRRVVWRETFWPLDEAVGVYVRSAGLFGNEMHSPILCIGHGVPAIVCRFAEQTSKGFMWKDLGLADWLFDHDDEVSVRGIVPAVLAMAQDPAAAKAKAAEARQRVLAHQRRTMAAVAAMLRAGR